MRTFRKQSGLARLVGRLFFADNFLRRDTYILLARQVRIGNIFREDRSGVITEGLFLSEVLEDYNEDRRSRAYPFASAQVQARYDQIWHNIGFLLKQWHENKKRSGDRSGYGNS